jgi:hypothetical protein
MGEAYEVDFKPIVNPLNLSDGNEVEIISACPHHPHRPQMQRNTIMQWIM